MSRYPTIDFKGVAAIPIATRFAPGIVEMIDLLADNRSKFIREATWEKINREMEQNRNESKML